MTDTEQLATHLQQDFPDLRPSVDRAWLRDPALRVIDCVLSLCRNYDRFVVPRLNQFESCFPAVRSVRELRMAMDRFGQPHEFVREALNYRDVNRARVLDAVVNRVLEYAEDSSGKTELERIERWAAGARPDAYKLHRIPGFALAGHQYLRMLFGANTTKPDVHICRYVSRCVDRKVSELEALSLLEGAAALSGIRLRDLDTTIWETSARPCSL